MTIEQAQQAVDLWIKEHGVRYFNELTNMAMLTEEVGKWRASSLVDMASKVKRKVIKTKT